MNQGYKSNFQTYVENFRKAKLKILDENEKFPKEIKDSFSKLLTYFDLLQEIFELAIDYDIPDEIVSIINNLYNITQFQSILNQILPYDYERDNQNNFTGSKTIKSEIERVYNLFISPFNKLSNGQDLPVPLLFVGVISLIKSYKVKNISEIEILKNEIKEKIAEINQLDEQIKFTAQQVITQKYAEVFEVQAKKHTYSVWMWLGLGAVFIFGGLCYLLTSNYTDLLIDKDLLYSWDNINYVSLTNRLLFLIFWFGFIKFSFRQYSIHSHLYVINKHRQNVMNSFKLLHDSLIDSNSEKDKELQKILALEVARVIFDVGQTGFIQSPEIEVQPPGIVEILKTLKENSNK
ncbi:MAG TPA: hypothetical protein PK453_21770 [Leptospiraceae bacterium]|nr:hypothetical protein [Leptospiraceae bacterium]